MTERFDKLSVVSKCSPLKVFLCYTHSDRDAVKALPAGTPPDQRLRGPLRSGSMKKNLVVSKAEPSSPAQTGNTKSAKPPAK